jgi:hypothetical protein
MELSTTFEAIESVPFMLEMGLAAGFKPFLDEVSEHPLVKQLWEATSTDEGIQQVQERVIYLCQQPFDSLGPCPFDTPLAVYLHLLYSRDHNLGKQAATLIYPLPNCYWAYGISDAILKKEEEVSHVG